MPTLLHIETATHVCSVALSRNGQLLALRESTVKNAQSFLSVQDKFGSFDRYIWDFVDGQPIRNSYETLRDLPSETDISRGISKDMRKRGFSFVGPTIIYAHMQATGMVNDHITKCYRYRELRGIVLI